MASRFVKGKTRVESPRLKDTPIAKSERDPSVGRDGSGRFASGNRASIGQGIKALIKKGLGNPDDPATAEMARAAFRLYLAELRDLPSEGPAVRQLVAARARHTVLAGFYANEAARVGLATPEGLKLAEAARSHDTTAQRLSVTAYDRAVREANADAGKPKDAHATAAEAFK